MDGRWLAAAFALSALAGCIQIQVPALPAGTSEVAAAPETPSAYPVTCVLRDGNGTPVTNGQCDYRFGALGARVPVGADGTAMRNVPVGATGDVTGSAPGHAGAKATLSVNGPKTVRMTLPVLPPGHPERVAPRADATGNATRDAAAQDDNGTFENATVYSGSQRVSLLSQLYAIAPAEPPAGQTYKFVVAPAYQRLEVTGSYVSPFAYAANIDLKLIAPNGTVALEYKSLDVLAVATGIGTGSGQSFPIGFVFRPEPGTYTVSVTGEGAPGIQLDVYGLIGLAPDFRFTNFLDSTPHHLNEYAGRIVIVDLMAAWCGPCNAAMPGLTAVRNDYHGKVEILSIDITYGGPGTDTPQSDTDQDLRDFITKHNVTWPIGPDSTDYATSGSSIYGTGWIPTMVLVDQHGGLMYRHIGEIDQAELRDRIDQALAAG